MIKSGKNYHSIVVVVFELHPDSDEAKGNSRKGIVKRGVLTSE